MCCPFQLAEDPAPCYLWRLHFPLQCLFPLSHCFPPLLLNSGSLKLPDGHSFQKGRENGRNWGFGSRRRRREDQSVPDTSVTYFLNWWDVLRKKNTKCEAKRKKNKISAPQVRDVTVGDELVMLCLSLICWTCRVLHNGRRLRDICRLNNPILLSQYENICSHGAALWTPVPIVSQSKQNKEISRKAVSCMRKINRYNILSHFG